MSTPHINAGEIINYYDDCEIDYSLVWQLKEVMCMHYGYWDEHTPHHRAALQKMNEIVYDAALIRQGD